MHLMLAHDKRTRIYIVVHQFQLIQTFDEFVRVVTSCVARPPYVRHAYDSTSSLFVRLPKIFSGHFRDVLVKCHLQYLLVLTNFMYDL